ATHQIVGLGAACELAAAALPGEAARLLALRERLWQGLAALGGVHLNGQDAPRVPGILNVSFEGVDGESLVSGLEGLAVSTGAACNSESREPSYVLRALGRDARLAESSLRLSLGRFSSEADVATAVDAVVAQVRRLRALSPAAARAPGGEAAVAGPGEALVSGEGGGPDQAAWVRLELLVAGDTVKDARFQALGCPHTLAVAGWLCERLRGRSRAELVPGTPEEWARAHAVPVEKLGRLLLLEAALRACRLHWPYRATIRGLMAISLTESAADRVKSFLAARGHGMGLRLGVRKTGCSGFAYVINYADGPEPGDAIFEDRGVRVFVDASSLVLIDGTIV